MATRLSCLLLLMFVASTEHLRGEEQAARTIEINLKDKSQDGKPILFALPDPALDPEIKTLLHDFNLDDDLPASDTSMRSYNLVCWERHAQQLKEPKQLTEFKFAVNAQDENPDSNSAKEPFVHRFRATLRRASTMRTPAGSKQIADKVVYALCDAREREQIRGFNIDLEIERGQVTLTGDVPSQKQRLLVAKIVGDVQDVRHVDNRLEVRESK